MRKWLMLGIILVAVFFWLLSVGFNPRDVTIIIVGVILLILLIVGMVRGVLGCIFHPVMIFIYCVVGLAFFIFLNT